MDERDDLFGHKDALDFEWQQLKDINSRTVVDPEWDEIMQFARCPQCHQRIDTINEPYEYLFGYFHPDCFVQWKENHRRRYERL